MITLLDNGVVAFFPKESISQILDMYYMNPVLDFVVIVYSPALMFLAGC